MPDAANTLKTFPTQQLTRIQIVFLLLDVLKMLEVASSGVVGTIERIFHVNTVKTSFSKKPFERLTPSEFLLLRQILKSGGSGKLSKEQVAMVSVIPHSDSQ